MRNGVNKKLKKPEAEPKIQEIENILKELDKVPESKTLMEAEELHRELSFISPNDLQRRFTI